MVDNCRTKSSRYYHFLSLPYHVFAGAVLSRPHALLVFLFLLNHHNNYILLLQVCLIQCVFLQRDGKCRSIRILIFTCSSSCWYLWRYLWAHIRGMTMIIQRNMQWYLMLEALVAEFMSSVLTQIWNSSTLPMMAVRSLHSTKVFLHSYFTIKE